MLMWCYGSNLNIAQMKRRCPKAKFKGPLVVNDAALVFRGVADVVVREGSFVPGGLWSISKDCERALDRYEGVASGLYVKRYFHLRRNKQVVDVLFYQMSQTRGVMPPGQDYLNTIAKGYKDFDLDLNVLEMYLQESWGDKDVTEELRRRYDAKGRPTLARDLDTERFGKNTDVLEYPHSYTRSVHR
jgi:hypothetical protein